MGSIERASPLRRIKSEFFLKKQKDEAKSGFSVTSYRSKVERAQADAIKKAPEALAHNLLLNKDISDI